MKKMKWNYLVVALISMAMMVTSCKKDDDDDGNGNGNEGPEAPVMGEDFDYSVDGNDVTFTTTLTGNVWFRNINSESNHDVEDGQVVVNLPAAGVYPFTCNTLIDGEEVASDTFDVEILQDNLGYLNEGMWLQLTGGSESTKTWRMDIREETPHTVYWNSPLHYSGADSDPYWSWEVTPDELPVTVDGTEMEGYFNWTPAYADNNWLMPASNYGTITFNGVEGTVTVDKFGETCEGTFSMDTAEWTLTINECILPIDSARVDGGQFEDADLHNLRIYSISDSALQIGVKRSYEPNDDGELQESEWVHVYNFVVDDYEYPQPEEFTYEEPVLTSFTEADLVGTWVYADVAQDWIGWTGIGNQGTTNESQRLNGWSTRDEMISTLTDWGGPNPDSTFTAADEKQYVFNDDGTCNLAGTETTYSVTDGLITFGDELTNEFSLVWINPNGTEIPVLDVVNDSEGNPYSYDGIWIGIQNEDKNESAAVHLVKQ